MKIYLALIFLFIEASVLASTISKEHNSNDTALFKVEEHVFYVTDVNLALKDINTFRCLRDKSILISGLQISVNDYQHLSPFVNDYLVLRRRQDQLEKLMILQKMLIYSVPLDVNVTDSDLKNIGFYKCFKGTKLSNTMKLMIKSEFHLRDRFVRSRKSFKLDENLREKLRIFYSGIDRKLKGQSYFR